METYNEEKDDGARQQAKAQMASIVSMVQRWEHSSECTGDEDCKLTDEEILNGLGIVQKGRATDDQRGDYHDTDAALTAILEDPLSVQFRSDWHNSYEAAEDHEFNMLLCTGGPAVRLIGEIEENHTASHVILQYQDWYTPWIEYLDLNDEEREALKTYATIHLE